MTLIYENHVNVTRYKIFGIYLFNVESVGIDYDACEVFKLNLGWFSTYFAASEFADKVRQGGAE